MSELQLIESGKIMQAEDFLLPGIAHLFQGENGDRHPATLRFDGEPVPVFSMSRGEFSRLVLFQATMAACSTRRDPQGK